MLSAPQNTQQQKYTTTTRATLASLFLLSLSVCEVPRWCGGFLFCVRQKQAKSGFCVSIPLFQLCLRFCACFHHVPNLLLLLLFRRGHTREQQNIPPFVELARRICRQPRYARCARNCFDGQTVWIVSACLLLGCLMM